MTLFFNNFEIKPTSLNLFHYLKQVSNLALLQNLPRNQDLNLLYSHGTIQAHLCIPAMYLFLSRYTRKNHIQSLNNNPLFLNTHYKGCLIVYNLLLI